MATVPLPRFTVGEYLALELESSTRHEYVEGNVVAMTGATYSHALVVANIGAELRDRVRQCSVVGSDMMVQVQPEHWFAYPDVAVTCGRPQFLEDRKKRTLTNPSMVVEVLSPNTHHFDCGPKAEAYRHMPTLKGFLLIEPDRVWIQHWARTADGWQSKTITDRNAVLSLEAFGCEIPVADIYRGVELAQT